MYANGVLDPTPRQVDAPATSTTFTGLTPGTSYTFTVQATNLGGSGPTSAQSNAVVPTGATAPAAVTNVSAVGDSTAARVTWTPSGVSTGSPLTGYTITPYIGSTPQTTASAPASASSATVTGLTNGQAYTFRVTATNAVGSTASSPSNAVTPRHSLLELATPTTVDGGDVSSVVLGMKFTASVNGSVTGIRFYKSSANTGTHVGTLWDSTGGRLTEASFANETASGWQTMTFASPVSITAGTTYVVSYLAPNGRYSVTGNGFSSGLTNGPLSALANSASANGVFAYSGTAVFPANTWGASNYWVDVLFAPGS